MKLVLKSISQDIDVADPEQGASSLVFAVEGTVPVGVATTLRVQVTDDVIQQVVNFLGLVHTEPQEPGEAGPDEEEEEFEEEPEDHQDEHPDVMMGATEFPPKKAQPAYPQQRRPNPRPVQRPQVEQDEDGTPSL